MKINCIKLYCSPSFEHHKCISIDLYCVVVEAEILKTDLEPRANKTKSFVCLDTTKSK